MLPVHAAWGHGGPIWVTDGGRNQMALFPPCLVFLSLRWSSTSRENSLSRGGGFGTPLWGSCLCRTLGNLP